MVGIALWAEGDPFQRAKEFVQRHKLTYLVLVDPNEQSKVAEAYGVDGVPVNIIIGRDGEILYRKEGFEEKALKGAMEAALKE